MIERDSVKFLNNSIIYFIIIFLGDNFKINIHNYYAYQSIMTMVNTH